MVARPCNYCGPLPLSYDSLEMQRYGMHPFRVWDVGTIQYALGFNERIWKDKIGAKVRSFGRGPRTPLGREYVAEKWPTELQTSRVRLPSEDGPRARQTRSTWLPREVGAPVLNAMILEKALPVHTTARCLLTPVGPYANSPSRLDGMRALGSYLSMYTARRRTS